MCDQRYVDIQASSSQTIQTPVSTDFVIDPEIVYLKFMKARRKSVPQ